MKILNAEQTIAALPYDALIKALSEGFRQTFHAPLRHHHYLKNEAEEDAVLLLMPAWFDETWGGVKMVNVVPGNVERGLAAISSSYILFNRRTGVHELLLDGAELTARRTAAAAALAASKLARPNSHTHLIVGAGRVGSCIPHAYKAVLPIKEILVFNRTYANAQRLVSELENDGFNARAVTSLEDSVPQSDIISCATLATAPVLLGEWLRPGQHVDLIGSFTPNMREVDDAALSTSSIWVDTQHALVESGDLSIPLANGVIDQGDINGSFLSLCTSEATARRSEDEITLFKAVGTAVEDLAAAVLAQKVAG